MSRSLSRTLLVILVLVMIGGALFGAFYLGQRLALTQGASEWYPRLDRDQVKPNLRDDGTRTLPWMPMHDRYFPLAGFPLIGFALGALWALVRLALLVLLVWIIVRLMLRTTHPAPPPPPAAPPQDPPAVITE